MPPHTGLNQQILHPVAISAVTAWLMRQSGSALVQGAHPLRPLCQRMRTRIRACLQQPESQPVALPAQIAVLQALTAQRFDAVPLARMAEAERAVHLAVQDVPAALCARLATAAVPSADDRAVLLATASAALDGFTADEVPHDAPHDAPHNTPASTP